MRIEGSDAKIYLNGAEFTSNTNNFSINGLTITANALTDEDEEITITTNTDVDAIYDMVKSFFSEYNSLINEMDSLYNAASAGDYKPLTEDEDSEMSKLCNISYEDGYVTGICCQWKDIFSFIIWY